MSITFKKVFSEMMSDISMNLDGTHSDEYQQQKQGIYKLPAEILIIILQFCDQQVDVWNLAAALSEKRNDIWNIIMNPKLWVKVVIPPEEKFIKFLGPHTETLKVVSSKGWKLTESFLLELKYSCTGLYCLNIMDILYCDQEDILSTEFAKNVLNYTINYLLSYEED